MDSDDDDVSLMLPSAKRRRILFELGFREPILDYLKRNANPRVLLKLMRVSKYFWIKEFPFTVIKDLKYENSKWKYRPLEWPKSHFFDTRKFQPFDFDNIAKKLWITESLYLNNKEGTNIASKVAVCDIVKLDLLRQKISLEEFKLFNAHKIKNAFFCNIIIEDSNNEILSVESILNHLPKALNFNYYFGENETLASESTKNIIENLKKSEIQEFTLRGIPETFEFDVFLKFMHENPKKKYDLSFNNGISAEYIQKLQTAVDYFIENCLTEESSVIIEFEDQTDESYEKLCKTWKRRFQ
uniref:DUF38 domain-containing protein n=1 Tax=Panagrolaimus sp. PS1159 TaxID=55785 RepID=A0AC35EX24_9BILA